MSGRKRSARSCENGEEQLGEQRVENGSGRYLLESRGRVGLGTPMIYG
jgi:hypothetical protein